MPETGFVASPLGHRPRGGVGTPPAAGWPSLGSGKSEGGSSFVRRRLEPTHGLAAGAKPERRVGEVAKARLAMRHSIRFSFALSRIIFRFLFPVAAHGTPKPREQSPGAREWRILGRAGCPVPKELHILVLEDDPGSQKSIQLMLDAEGWKVTILGDASTAFQELAKGTWALVIASMTLVDMRGPLFQILKELAQAAPVEEGRSRLRVLFVVPADEVTNIIPVLENDHLPYATKPYHFNTFMEKVNDLLIQAQFIGKTARERGFAFEQRARTKSGKSGKKSAPASSMFASRDEYYYTEEELAEYERQQSEEEKKRKKSKLGERPI